MKTQNAIPNYTLKSGTPRSWLKQTNATGHIISNLRRRRAPPSPWPPGSDLSGGPEPPAAGNRRWHDWVFDYWKNVLLSADRAAWDAAAPSISIVNIKGKTITPNGFTLFQWWQAYQTYATWYPTLPFNPLFYSVDNTPTDPTWTKPIPTNIYLINAPAPNFTIAFTAQVPANTTQACLSITPARLTGCKLKTSKWHRLQPASMGVYTPISFSANVKTGHPVPPWTSTPTYSAPDWNGNGVGLVGLALSATDTITAGISSPTYNVSATWANGPIVADTAITLTWGIKSTGQRYALVLTAINPSTGIPYPDNRPRFFICSFTTWSASPTYITPGLKWTGYDINSHVYSLTRDGTNDTVTTPAGNITNPVASPPATDVGITANVGPYVTYLRFSVSGPLFTWTASFTYQNIIENPATHGPRNARLVIGATPGYNLRHSDPALFELDL